MPGVLLSAKAVADRLGLTKNTVLEYAQLGRIPAIRVSPRIVRFDWEEVVKALKRRKK